MVANLTYRRRFLQALSAVPFLGFAPSIQAHGAPSRTRNLFKELGVRPIINACGNYTRFGGSLMPAEVMRAMADASTQYVRLDDLQDAVGARIAALASAESAMVTAGAASAISLGTAACITGNNPDFLRRIPETSGMRSEVVILKSHRNSYDHAIRASGATLREAVTAEDIERAIGPQTAMLAFFNLYEPTGPVKPDEFVAIAKRHGIPTLIDAAADLPPLGNLSKFNELGFDLVCISGGKAISGPQSAGFLLGRRDLIEAARLNTSPHSGAIYRGMKVGKEEMIGVLVALEMYLTRDHERDRKEWERRVARIAASVRTVAGVSAELWLPPIASHMPHVKVVWDASRVRCSVKDAMTELSRGDPPIEANSESETQLILAVFTLKAGEDKIVASRLRTILKQASV